MVRLGGGTDAAPSLQPLPQVETRDKGDVAKDRGGVCLFVILYFYPAAWCPKGYGSDLSLPLRADDLFPPALPISDPRPAQAAA